MDAQLVKLISEKAVTLKSTSDVTAELCELIRAAGFVLLGEASHGTHEFYKNRAEITKRLITEHDFCAIAVEAAKNPGAR